MPAPSARRSRAAWLFASLAGCRLATLPKELLAGCVLAGLLVPQGLGYAGIAGVELVHGLYAAMAGLVAYAAFGTSRHLVVSPTSSAAALLAAAVAPLAVDATSYGNLAAGLAMGTGLILVAGSVLRLGFVSHFIAKPVLKGFMFGLALRIIVKQAPDLLGVEKGGKGVFEQVQHVISSLGSANATTAVLGVATLALGILLPRLTRAVPPALLALLLGIGAVKVLGLEGRGVALVGNVPTGLPEPRLPGVGLFDADALWAAGVGIAVIVYAEALGAARTLAAKHRYDVVPNRELLALGAANVASGLFQGVCVGGGLSASAANDAAGARSSASALTAAGLIVLTLLFLMPVFAILPKAILAAIVIDAVRRVIDVRELARYVRLRSGVLPHLTALAGVLVLGLLPGLLLAVLVSLVLLMRALSTTEVTELGRLNDTHVFVPLGSEDGVSAVPGLVILRPEGPLFFGNADRVRERIRDALRADAPPREVIVNLGATPVAGVAGNDLIQQFLDDVEAAGARLSLARVSPQLRGLLERSGLLARLSPERVFVSQSDAVEAFERRAPSAPGS